jgi:hypothetical protein
MKYCLSIIALAVVTGCASSSHEGVPVEDWPAFLPFNKTEYYLGFKYRVPSLGGVYGGLKNLKIVKDPRKFI